MNTPLSEDEKQRILLTLDAQTKQLTRIEGGLFGDEKLGMDGLVKDMKEMKQWRAKVTLRVTFLTGICMSVIYFLKWAAEGLRDWLTLNIHPKA